MEDFIERNGFCSADIAHRPATSAWIAVWSGVAQTAKPALIALCMLATSLGWSRASREAQAIVGFMLVLIGRADSRAHAMGERSGAERL